MMRRLLSANFLVLLLCLAGAGAYAQAGSALPMQTILQTINDEPISSYDVDARMGLVIATAGEPPNEAGMRRIRAQVLQTLIDERVQLQEAERLGITVSDQEIQGAIANIEKSNRMQSGDLVKALSARNVDVSTLVAQIRATLAWRQVVRARGQARVEVADEDVERYLDDLRQKGGTEYLLAEVFIAAPRPQELPRARATAEELIAQMRKGATFSSLARQYSQSPTAAAGGDMGWVEPDQLDPRLARAVEGLRAGQITEPVELDDGFTVLAVRNRRQFGAEGQEETVYDIRRYYAPFDPKAPNATKVRIYRTVQRAYPAMKTCADVERLATAGGDKGSNMGEVRLGDLPGPLQPIIEKLKPGEKTEVLPLVDGILVMMLCDIRVNKLGLPERDQVRETLLNRRLDQEARRMLRDLRQNAMIEVLHEG